MKPARFALNPISLAAVLGLSLFGGAARAEAPSHLIDELSDIRSKAFTMQRDLVDGFNTKKTAQANMRKIKMLLSLQKKEREVGQKRLKELEGTVNELESRRAKLNEKIALQQGAIRKFLMAIERSLRSEPSDGSSSDPRRFDRMEAPRRKLLANLSDRSLKEAEVLRIDLDDADQLENRIQDEKQQLAYLFQDLKEQEGVLELNQQLQVELLQKTKEDRIVQLQNYRKLKEAEFQVEHLVSEFSARKELQKATEVEQNASRLASVSMKTGASPGLNSNLGALGSSGFAQLRGHLPLPVSDGRIVSGYGRAYDPNSKLFIFKKGVDIQTGKGADVDAVFSGRIAFAGELPDYGRVAIIDHGDHFYSLCAHLGKISRKAGDSVKAGEPIGIADDSGTPVYFEIRSRNVAVNPLQWFAN